MKWFGKSLFRDNINVTNKDKWSSVIFSVKKRVFKNPIFGQKCTWVRSIIRTLHTFIDKQRKLISIYVYLCLLVLFIGSIHSLALFAIFAPQIRLRLFIVKLAQSIHVKLQHQIIVYALSNVANLSKHIIKLHKLEIE